MQQQYYCPNCKASVFCGDRFCGNCGISLNWAVQQMPVPLSPLSHGYQYTDQQQTWCQQREPYNRQVGWYEQSGLNLPTVDNQESASGNLNQYQQRYRNGNLGTASQKKSSSEDGAVTPISIEISKLLADFFDKRSNCKKAG